MDAKIEEQSRFKELLQAIADDSEAKIKAALADGFNVNAKDYLGRTLLMFAAEAGQGDIVNILIAAGAKLDARDQMNENKAFIEGLRDSNFESRRWGGKTALHCAAANHHAEVVTILLTAGAKVDVVDKCKQTPLDEAVQSGDITIAETLLRAGANPNGSEKGPTPLSSAINIDSPLPMVRVLLRYGANPNHPANLIHMPVLDSAVIGGHVEVCRELVNAGADLYVRDAEHGRTALDLVNYLIDNSLWMASQLEKGIDKARSTKDRKTIRDILTKAMCENMGVPVFPKGDA